MKRLYVNMIAVMCLLLMGFVFDLIYANKDHFCYHIVAQIFFAVAILLQLISLILEINLKQRKANMKGKENRRSEDYR